MNRLPLLALLLGALALYVVTLASGVLPADSGEFQVVATTLGIAHPPGYPLYTLLGWGFTRLTPANPAWGLNLLSALLAVATLAVVYVSHPSYPSSSSLLPSLSLMGVTTFWAAATTANIRILVALFTALLLWLALWALDEPTPARLAWLALVTGLALSHHGSLVFTAAPAWLVVGWRWVVGRQRWSEAGRALGYALAAFLLGLTPWLYLLLRGAPGQPPQPEALATVNAWLDHILARGFGGDMFAFARSDLLPDRLLVLADILRFQFGWPLLALALLGLLGLTVTAAPRALLLGLALALPAFVAITYRAPQTVEYLMPAYIPLALLVGLGAQGVGEWLGRWVGRWGVGWLVALVVVGLAGWNIAHLWPSYWELHLDQSTEQAAAALLQAASPNATVFAGWHQATPLWYRQAVAGQRPDVQVVYVLPAGAEPYPQTWRRRLEQATQTGPALATNWYATYQGAPFSVTPLVGGFLAQRGDPTLTPDFTPMDVALDGGIHLAGVRWPDKGQGATGPTVTAGEMLTVDLFWQAEQAVSMDTSFFVHLVDSAGQVVGQADVTRAGGDLGVGRRWVTRHRLPVLLTSTPGRYRLVAGGYRAVGGQLIQLQAAPVPLGEIEIVAPVQPPVMTHSARAAVPGVSLTGWSWDTTLPDQARLLLSWRRETAGPAVEGRVEAGAAAVPLVVPEAPGGHYWVTTTDLPPDADAAVVVRGQRLEVGSSNGERWLSFGGQMALVGVTAERRGGELVVDLDWLALKPLTNDYTVSVKGRGAGWTAQHDGTPAQGAVPTLKWVEGMRVRDRHRLTLPAAAPGPITISVGVYDAFTAALLGVQDDRLLKLGQGDEAAVLMVE
ncbi:MAG: DUF2723 domain-containing protein [Anaerolineae bacterium]|nr:DUF2723 domain-containing protein [Anaerolineae bacterium]